MASAVSQAWQSWTSAKGVAALAALALAVGIGSATAMYTVVHSVMLKPLPYREGERFVALYGAQINDPAARSAHAAADLRAYQERTRSFDAFGWFTPVRVTMLLGDQPEQVSGAAVTPSLVQSLGVAPTVGQWFTDEQGVVISAALWQRLGSNPAIVGTPLRIDGRPYTITGVMPPAFRLPVPGPGVETFRSDLWLALDAKGERPGGDGFYFAYARLRPGVTFPQADADVRRVAAEIAALEPASHRSYTARLDDLHASILIAIRPTLLLLVGGAGLLLLIACVDVAGLLLARAVGRSRETAIRLALGAGHRRLAAHYFFEGLLVSLAGAAGGLALSLVLVRVVVSLAAAYIPRADEIAVDGTVLLFAIAAAAVTSGIASAAPLWQAVRTAPADALNEGVRATGSARTRRLSRALVVGEIALAFTLLAVSAALIVHLRNLARVDPGFNPDGLVTFHLTPASPIADSNDARVQYQSRLIAALEGIPGVSGAAVSNQLPLDGCCLSTTIIPEDGNTDAKVTRTAFLPVSPGYFRTLGVPVLSGRVLDARDVNEKVLVVAINQAAATAYWPGRNAVGAFGRFGGREGSRFQVVGVVGDVRNDNLAKPVVPEVYLAAGLVPFNPIQVLVRSPLPLATLAPAIRQAIHTFDAAQPVEHLTAMRDTVRASLSLERVGSFMLTFFAVAALLMATLGVYSVVAYAVRQGTVEIGTRMALGAVGGDVMRLVLGGGFSMAAYGMALGAVPVVLAAWTLMRTFEIHDLGVLPFAGAAAVIGFVALAASFFPAWQATQLSPMVAMRNDPGSALRTVGQSLRQTLHGWSSTISFSRQSVLAADDDVLTAFVGAARDAESFRDAIRAALDTLCHRLGATSALLLERVGGEYRSVVVLPENGAGATDIRLADDSVLVNRLRFYSHPLPFAASDLEGWERWAEGMHATHAAEIAMLRARDARIAVPLRAKDEMLGLLILGPSSSGAPYSAADRRVLRQCAEPLTLMIENTRLNGRVVEQEKVRRDLALAAEVQRRLLPEHAPVREGASLAAVSVPARSVGGDYYDFIDLGNQRIGIALADIAGKGIAAALIMSVVQASLRIVVAEGAADGETPLPELAARINTYLHRSTRSNSYATFFYAQLDERSRQLRYVNAGHNPPYLLRPPGEPSADGETGVEIRELSIGGTVLGLFPQMTYDEAVVDLRSGDVLVAFTDGVTEALNTAEEEFGEDRLKALLAAAVRLSAPDIAARLSEALRSWITDTAQYDDLTFVVMKVS